MGAHHENVETKLADLREHALVSLVTIGVVDRDGDLFLPNGNVYEEEALVSRWNHSTLPQFGGEDPVGRAKVFEQDGFLFADVKFDETAAGKSACKRVAEEKPDWSVGLAVLDSRPPTDEEKRLGAKRVITRYAVVEASPVTKGAGISTGTHAVCCDACKTGAKCSTEVMEEVKAKCATIDDTKILRALASHIGNLIQKAASPEPAATSPKDQKQDPPKATPAPAAASPEAVAPGWQVEALHERLARIHAHKTASGAGA
jgi:hypothetical protein